jgi:hypothetical protein
MKRLGCCLCGLAAGWLIAAAAVPDASAAPKKNKDRAKKQKGARKAKAGEKQGKKKKGKSQPQSAGKPGEVSFASMRRELHLNKKQANELRPLWQERDRSLADWDATDQGLKLAQLREQLVLTPGPERASLATQVRYLQAQRDRIARKHDAKILAVLNGEQRAKWLGFLLYRGAVIRLGQRGVHLTTDQARQARDVCNSIAAALPTAPDQATMDQAQSRALREIFASILTAKQRKGIDPDSKGEKDRKKAHKNKKKNRSGRRRSGGRRQGRRGGGRSRAKTVRRSGKEAKPQGGGRPIPKPKVMGIGRSKASRLKPKGPGAARPGPKVTDLHRSGGR